MSIGKTFNDFRAAHDPTYVIQEPLQVFERPLDPDCKVFVVTSAQNGTPAHKDFLACLKTYCTHRSGELLINPLRYKNPTSQWLGSQKNEEWWTADVRPLLWNSRLQLHTKLTLLADIKTQPTAVSPLSGFDAISGDASGILGHTKLQLRTIATPQGRMAKILTTTGCVTQNNYTDTKTGKIGGFHHSYSAVVVELDGPRFHLRQLHYSATARRIIDLDTAYSAKNVYRAPRALALVCGDTHVRFIDPQVEAATYGKDGILDVTRPEHVIQHDLMDGHSCNPHHKGNLLHGIAKRGADKDSIRDETFEAANWLNEHTPADTVSVVVDSNHDDFLSRAAIDALEKGFAKFGAKNVEFLLETALMLVQGAKFTEKGTEYPDAFVSWLKIWFRENARIRTLTSDESFLLGGVELGMHGHLGPNGARGSRRNLARIGVKSIIGHSHSPGIEEGCYQTGTSTRLRLEYNHGASSWLNTHCLLNADGKRQLLNIIDGRWRG